MTMPMIGSSTLSARSQSLAHAAVHDRYLCFGNFHVDLKREELFKDGTRLRIPSKVYQVLLALMERPGEVVTRDHLRARLWPEGTFVNYDANVNTTVNKLRLALGDEPEAPQWIETIPRQGYCFVGAVQAKNEVAKTVAREISAADVAAMAAGEGLSIATNAAPKLDSDAWPLPLFLRSGWAVAVLLSGVLIGIGIVLLTRHSA